MKDPTPGNDKPATEGGTQNDAGPTGFSLVGIAASVVASPVMSYTRIDDQGHTMEVNVTLPGHPLFPGVVVRVVEQGAGKIVVHNFGEGTSQMQDPASYTLFGDWFVNQINNVWYNQTNKILEENK